MANLLAAALAPFGWDAAATGFRLWTPSTASHLALTRCPGGGFALVSTAEQNRASVAE